MFKHSRIHSIALFTFLSFVFISVSFAREYVTFPSKYVVKKAFEAKGWQDIVKKTNILDIVDQKLTPLEVVDRVDKELREYCRKKFNEDVELVRKSGKEKKVLGSYYDMGPSQSYMGRNKLLETLLQNDPEALQALMLVDLYRTWVYDIAWHRTIGLDTKPIPPAQH